MTQSIQRPNHQNAAQVISLNQHRRATTRQKTDEHPFIRRAKLVRTTIDRELTDSQALPLAAAIVVLRSDGQLSSVTEAIEPEQADIIADGLEDLARRLRSKCRKSRDPSQRGFGRMGSILSLLFMAATYINENAAIDAALSLAAQVTIAITARPRR